MKKIALLCVFAVLPAFWASSSVASEKADSANRFRLVADDDGLGGVNVRISETTSTALPLDIRDRVGTIVSACIVGHVDVTKIKYYQYESERTRQRGLKPNYIVDFSAMKEREMKACSFPVPVCSEDTGCLLVGYSAGNDGSWEMGFSRSALQWGMGNYSLPEGNQGTYIEIRSVDPSCQSRQGTAGGETCQERFVWGSFSLKPLWNY